MKAGCKSIFATCKKRCSLSTAVFKMLIKFFGNNFMLVKILFNIVSGIYFPVLTNPSI